MDCPAFEDGNRILLDIMEQAPWPVGTRLSARASTLDVFQYGEAVLNELETQFARGLEQARTRLKLQRALPINTLPQNILSHIFQFASLPGMTILNIARTCSYWRSVALTNHGLWSTLELSALTGPQSSVFLSRSSGRPLTVILLNYSAEVWTWYPHRTGLEYETRLQICRTYLPRIRSLQLDIVGSHRAPTWLSSDEALLLEYADIAFIPQQSPGHGLTHPTLVLPNFFAAGKNQLTNLVLRHVFVPWATIARAPSLTMLHVNFSHRIRQNTCADRVEDLDVDLLEIFKTCKQLEDLSLTCSSYLRGLPLTLNDTALALPALKSIKLHLMSPDVRFVLRSIAIPEGVSVLEVICRLDPCCGKDEWLIDLPEDPLCLPCLMALRSLDVNVPGHVISGSLEFALNGAFYPIILCTNSHGNSNGQTEDVAIAATFDLLQTSYHMPRLAQLTITDNSENHYFTARSIISFFFRSPMLTELTLHGCNHDILKTLSIFLPSVCLSLTYVYVSDMTIPLPILEQFCRSYFCDPEYELSVTLRDKADGPMFIDTALAVNLSMELESGFRELWLDQDVHVETEDKIHVVYIAGHQRDDI